MRVFPIMIWKTFAGRCIYQSQTGTRVYENMIFRWLKFESKAIQTLINKHYPASPALHYIKPLLFMAKQFPDHCCLMGLGGAGAAHALSPFLTSSKITAVEISQEIVDVASRFFMLSTIPNLEVIHQDAFHFIENTPRTFRHIIVDLFNASHFPPHCNNDTFFALCKSRLSKDGILAVNLANRQEQRPIFEMMQRQFGYNMVSIPVEGCANLVILASNSEDNQFLKHYFTTHKQVKRMAWDATWGHLAAIKQRW
ncbi:hypothetical protein D6J04_04175 [Legionella taurinensis]|uniref:Spermidine synthase n=2 Tax=Legionella taurinensis TaxID=70611 RepID=A0A3A5L5Z5_9GAMM|nr:hypothetical protein D6J04_04175 [Legionella taurinensis]RJT69033.1 hypothetical protein D6J03_03040 [Legionella taurinensis]